MIRIIGRLLVPLLLTVLLSACANRETKPAVEPTPVSKPPAVVPTPQSQPAQQRRSPVAQSAVQPAKPVNPFSDPANLLSKRSVYFDFDQSEVKPEFRPIVEAHAKYLREHPGARIVIQGNTDERGGHEYNIALGQRRAEAVLKTMVLLGAHERQMEAISYGKEKPKALGRDEASWAENRRDDIVYQRME